MKKMIFLLTLLLAMAGTVAVSSCNGCAKGADAPKIDDPVVVYHDYDGVVEDFTAGTARSNTTFKARRGGSERPRRPFQRKQ